MRLATAPTGVPQEPNGALTPHAPAPTMPRAMADAADRAVLVVERNDQPPRRFVLAANTFRIGRATDNDLQVPEGHISKHHADIRREPDGFVLTDVGSRAGVLVNGEVVQRRVLQNGDVIELGSSSPVRIRFTPRDTGGISTLELTMAGGGPPEQGGMGRLARFFEFSRKLGGGFSLDEVLQDVVDLAIEVTRAERGMLLLRREGRHIDMRVARTHSGHSLPTDGLRISETLVHKVLDSGRTSVIEDVNQDADLALAESVVSLELRSAVTLPLLRFVPSKLDAGTATSEVFGLIYLDSRKQRGGFDGYDLRILERLAQDASSVIENARLLGEAEEKRRIDREILMARDVQAALMPEQFVSTKTWAIAGTCVPCHTLGGDYVDQFDLGGGRQALVVADVAGKGVAASLLAATLQGALAAEIAEARPLGETVTRVNRVHCRLAPVGKFITMVVAVLEPDGSVALVNAGHCPVLHAGANGVGAVAAPGIALGLDADAEYREHVLRLAPGDSLLLYSDGVVESEGPDRELFGEARLVDLVARAATLPAAELLAEITRAIDTFRRGVAVTDDVTVLAVRRR